MKSVTRNVLTIGTAFVTYLLVGLVSTIFTVSIPLADYSKLILYMVLFIISQSQPVKLGNSQITLSLAFLLAIFLQYGLVVEVWVSAIGSMIAFLLTSRLPWKRILFLNTSIIWISMLSAGAFYLTGGKLKPYIVNFQDILPIVAYGITSLLVSYLFTFIYHLIILKEQAYHLQEYLRWSFYTILISAPLGVLIYIVDLQTGINGILLISIPILAFSYFFKLYVELHQASQQLKNLHDVSMEFTSELNLEKTVSSILQGIEKMISYDCAVIYLINEKDQRLYPYRFDNHRRNNLIQIGQAQFPIGEGIVGEAAALRRGRLIDSSDGFVKTPLDKQIFSENKSLLLAPIYSEDQIFGMIVLGSTESRHFQPRDLHLSQILASQAAVAIQNALRYEQTERRSLTDELTGLYNYRVFHQRLDSIFQESKLNQRPLSLLVIDIDHFKRVNDTFGHMVGNQTLIRCSEIIQQNVREKDIVARYGGEEFTVILPDTHWREALKVAERIRDAVENARITISKEDQKEDRADVIDLAITVSIGVASYPEHAEDAITLIRHADRAMYVGSKQQGRNRVSLYNSK